MMCFQWLATTCTTAAQTVLFNFDNAPAYTPLPITLTESAITAHFNTTGQGLFHPECQCAGLYAKGFAGNCIYPNSIYLTDLYINFDQAVTYFSILYACQELGCDDAATMRVTALAKAAMWEQIQNGRTPRYLAI